MRLGKISCALAMVLLLVGLSSVLAQQPSPRPGQQPSPGTAQPSPNTPSPSAGEHQAGTSQKASIAASDRQWVLQAGAAGIAEVELGRTAADKATRQEVKDFARRMVDDHGKANDELKSLAQQKGLDVPAGLDAKHKKLQDRLSGLSGEQFDQQYMNAMLSGHRDAVTLFTRGSKSLKDPDLKAFATKTLPTVKEHLTEAQKIAGSKKKPS